MKTKKWRHPKHQTVKWWIEQLKALPPKAVVHIATGSFDPTLCMLGVYEDDEDKKKIYIDVGRE